MNDKLIILINGLKQHLVNVLLICGIIITCVSDGMCQLRLDDLSILKLSSPYAPHTGASKKLSILVSNEGANKIDSFEIRWKLNGIIQYTKKVITPLNSSTLQSNVVIREIIFENTYIDNPTNQLEFEVISVNGKVDTFVDNNSIVVSFGPPISGTVLVGSNNANFPNLTKALDALPAATTNRCLIVSLTPSFKAKR